MADGEVSVVDIDPNGDTIIELSLNRKTRLLVSSTVLTLASPVFGKMLTSPFKEGLSSHANQGKTLISLPDDHAEAFLVICNIVHHRNHQVPKNITIDCLENFALICDKYDLMNALRPSSTVLLQNSIANSTAKDFNKLLFAAYVLDIPDAFTKISWEILLVQVGPYIDLPGVSDHSLVSRNILAEFDARSAMLRTSLAEVIERSIPSFRDCTGASQSAVECFQELGQRGLWPMSEPLRRESLAAAFKKISVLEEPKRHYCTKSYCTFCHKRYSFRGQLRDWREDFLSSRIGLCLDCVRTGRRSLHEKECRIQHS